MRSNIEYKTGLDTKFREMSAGIRIFKEHLDKDDAQLTINEIRRKLIFKHHCGKRMRVVECVDPGVTRMFVYHVCEICGHHKYRYPWVGMG